MELTIDNLDKAVDKMKAELGSNESVGYPITGCNLYRVITENNSYLLLVRRTDKCSIDEIVQYFN